MIDRDCLMDSIIFYLVFRTIIVYTYFSIRTDMSLFCKMTDLSHLVQDQILKLKIKYKSNHTFCIKFL